MNKSVLIEAINLYGSDLADWPDHLSDAINEDPRLLEEFLLLSAEEVLFEQLLSSRSFTAHADDYAQRIIAHSLDDTTSQALEVAHISNKVSVKRVWIRPMLGMAATLIIGLTVGYSFPLTQESTIEESFNDYTALFYVQENLL